MTTTLPMAAPEPVTARTSPQTVTLRIWRGDATAGRFEDYSTPVSEGMVVLDAVHQMQADAGQRPRRALELQGGQVRLLLGRDQRQTARSCA